jgi:ketosteroid isomerase-like protein
MELSSPTDPTDHDAPLAAEQAFFGALRAANAAALADVLADDFVLVDVMRGGEIPRAAMIEAIASRQIAFDTIEVLESRLRRYGHVAVIVGRTRMTGRAGAAAWTVASRYTHVLVEQHGRWRMVSAQGTPIAD